MKKHAGIPDALDPCLSLREVVLGTNGTGLLASRQIHSPSQANAQWLSSDLHDPQMRIGLLQWRGRAGFAPDFRLAPFVMSC